MSHEGGPPFAGGEAPFVRRLVASDSQELTRFFIANDRPDTRQHFHPFPLDGETARRLTTSPGRDLYFGIFLGRRLAGFFMLRGWNEGYDIPSFGVLVGEAERGTGLGRLAVREAVAAARRAGAPAVRLSVGDENMRAFGLYLSEGFSVSDSRESVVDGRTVRSLILTRSLGEAEGSGAGAGEKGTGGFA